jgi:peptidyl-dipeptidase A
MKRPEDRNEPDFASKYHVLAAPAYYQNYMLGEMFASQTHHALVKAVLPGEKLGTAIYVGNKAAGEFLKERVFAPGMTLPWNELTRHATGESLNAKAFGEDLKVKE